MCEPENLIKYFKTQNTQSKKPNEYEKVCVKKFSEHHLLCQLM